MPISPTVGDSVQVGIWRLEQAQLQHARRVEAVDSEAPRRRRRGRASRHQPDELGADTSAPRACASASTRATMSCSAAASQSSTFMLTCTTPARGRSSPSARTPGKPPSRSRTTAAISRAASTVAPRKLTLNAISGRARADDHSSGALVEPRRPEVRRQLAGVHPALQLLGSAAAEERRPAPAARARRRGTPAARAPRRSAGELRARTRAPAPCPRGRSAPPGRRRRRRSADARLRAPQVDPLPRDGDRREQRRDELVLAADEREDRTVVIRVAVHVEQPRVRSDRVADRVDRLAVAPSEKFGTDSSSSARAYSRSRVKEYYDTRAPEYDDWYLGHGRFADRDRPGWDEELAALAATIAALPPSADARRRLRHRLSHAASARRSSASTRATTCSPIAQRAAAGRDVRAGRRPRAPVPGRRFDRLFTGHFYGHLEERERVRFLAEARRVAAELVVVDAALDEDSPAGGAAGTDPERRLALDGLQALLRAGRARRRARRRRDALCRPLVRRGAVRDAAPLELPLDRIAAARQPHLPRVRRGRLSARVAADRPAVPRPARVHVRTGARDPGGPERLRGAVAPARRCGAGSSSTRTRSTRRSTARRSRAATRAARRRGRGDRTPTPRSRSSARSGASGSSSSSVPA